MSDEETKSEQAAEAEAEMLSTEDKALLMPAHKEVLVARGRLAAAEQAVAKARLTHTVANGVLYYLMGHIADRYRLGPHDSISDKGAIVRAKEA